MTSMTKKDTQLLMKNKKAVLSDHNSILLHIKAEPNFGGKKGIKDSGARRWHLTERGVEELEKVGEEIFSNFNADDSSSTQAAYNKFDQCMNDTMKGCFKLHTGGRTESNPAKKVESVYTNMYKAIMQFSKKREGAEEGSIPTNAYGDIIGRDEK